VSLPRTSTVLSLLSLDTINIRLNMCEYYRSEGNKVDNREGGKEYIYIEIGRITYDLE
jgi:hypothetical protein